MWYFNYTIYHDKAMQIKIDEVLCNVSNIADLLLLFCSIQSKYDILFRFVLLLSYYFSNKLNVSQNNIFSC